MGSAVREAAARDGLSVSAWLARAAADHLRNGLLGDALDAWEAENGAFTKAELATARATLARSAKRKGKAA